MSKTHRKGFIFTISVILFASTLLVYAQNFAIQSSQNEQAILAVYALTAGKHVSDDIGFDIAHIIGFSADVNYYAPSEVPGEQGAIVHIDGYTQQPYRIAPALADYNAFVNTALFPLIGGTQSLDVSALSDGSAELAIGNSLAYVQKYDTNDALLLSNGSTLSSLDLKLSSDRNIVSYVWAPVAGSVPVRLQFVSDANFFVESASINPASASTLLLKFADANVLVTIGSVQGHSSSLFIDSNSIARTRYLIDANYSYVGDGLPMDLNAILSHRAGTVDVTTLVRYKE